MTCVSDFIILVASLIIASNGSLHDNEPGCFTTSRITQLWDFKCTVLRNPIAKIKTD